MSDLALVHPQMMLVRFEPGRGRSGVPRCWLVVTGTQEVRSYVRQAVGILRAMCADPSMHGRDIMPGEDDEYLLHNIDGGVLETMEDIRWEPLTGGQQQRAELVLTWDLPSSHLAGARLGSE